jgi:hypothetical protein
MPRKTNIIIRNGTTVPSGADFNVGEPAWDKTAKKLYIKADDNTMAEIGAGGGSVSIGASAADVLSATAGEITADDAGSDKLVFWDDSESKLTYLTLGDGVAVSGTTVYAEDWFVVAASDETTSLTVGSGKTYFRMPYAATLIGVRASVNTVASGITIVDINESGSSVLGTKLHIDANEKTSTTAASGVTISDAALADDAEISIDIDQVGTAPVAKGLKVYLKVRRG